MDSLQSLFPTDADMALDTDLYQLTMAAAYFANDMNRASSFELFVRQLPPGWGFLVAAGLEQALHHLARLRVSGEGIDYLRGLPAFRHVPGAFFEYLREFRFSGEVWAMPEGTPFFPHEPVLRVTGPAIEAQLVETYLLTTINFQSLIASKAARVAGAAAGRQVVEFGTRRAHGPQAGLLAARASYLGGCDGTSNVLAGQRLGIPLYGTMAHSWVMANPDEAAAFRRYQELFPEAAVLLIDTYDTAAGAREAVRLQRPIKGVRLDSGDFLALSREVRRILDDGGLRDAIIFLSGDLNERKIAELVAAGAPVDGFGVGTELVTSKDHPALGGVYKLVELEEAGRAVGKVKLSEGKASLPGRKQVFRAAGGDVLGLADEPGPDNATPLLGPVMRDGRLLADLPPLEESRDHARRQIAALPAAVRALDGPAAYPVRRSEALEALYRACLAMRPTLSSSTSADSVDPGTPIRSRHRRPGALC